MSHLHSPQAHRMSRHARAEFDTYRVRTTRTHGVVVALVTTMIAFGLPKLAAAQGLDIGLDYASGIGLGAVDVRETVANLIRSLLSLVGFVLVLMIMWSGMQMMLASGDEERTTAAKASLKNAVVGFLVIMTSVSITKFVIDAITQATGMGGGSSLY